LRLKLSGLIQVAEDHLKAGEMEDYETILPKIEKLEAQIKAASKLEEVKALTVEPEPVKKKVIPLPLGADDGGEPAQKSAEVLEAEAEAALMKSIRVARYGNIDETKAAIARQIVGQDYLTLVDAQEQAFNSYLRYGETKCANRGISLKALHRQVWSLDVMTDQLKSGLSVNEIKTTMIEGADVLGGYAVPPQRATEILARMAGLTAVRNSGALVIQTASSSIEWLKLRGKNTGGSVSSVYQTGLRGAWGHETQSPGASNFEVAMERIPVEVYTYKVPMSVSLIEDAPNIVTILQALVANVLASDEDIAFVTGDGANKPRGLLPGSANSHAFTEVASGVSADIEIATTKALRRGIATQYRRGGSCAWMWESATASEIEQWQDGFGRFYLETVEAGERFFRFPAQETEAMPTIAASAYPILFGDFSGYAIVERLGLSVVRFLDGSTGINQVEFQVRRRIGGDVIEPYKFAVLKCDA